MARLSRTARAHLRVSPFQRIYLGLHGTLHGGTRQQAEAAWWAVRDDMLAAAVARPALRLPEAWYRFEGPAELRPYESSDGMRTATSLDLEQRRAAWLAAHAEELGI